MRYSRVLRNFLLGYAVLHLLAAGVFLVVITAWLRTQMINQTRQRLLDLSLAVREHIQTLDNGLHDSGLLQYLQQLEAETTARFTLITADGDVVVDSRTGYRDIGYHGDRDEVKQAAREGVGFQQRNSATLDVPLLYLAILYLKDAPANDPANGFVRVAFEERSVLATISALQTFLLVFTIGTGLIAGLLMIVFATREMQPLQTFANAARTIAGGQYASIPAITRRNDEWRSLSEAFSHMQSQLLQREDRLRENSMRLQAVLGSMVEGVLSLDADRMVLVANEAVCEMLGVPQEDLIGQSLADIVRIPELGTAVQQTWQSRQTTQTEFEIPGTRRRILEARLAPFPDQDEFGVAIVMHDVTEVRNLETIRRDFVANVSHELKTPLASIKAYAETLRMGALNDPLANQGFVEQIETQADVLHAQIGDLLKLSEIESGRTSFEREQISVNELLTECRERFLVEAEQQQITMEIECDPAATVRTDRLALETIMDNLVSNAIRYSKTSGRVQLRARVVPHGLVLEVTDNGIGISPADQQRVFERFFRVDKARSRDVGGTGLGLAIVKHTVLALGGSVELESKPGLGSTFRIRLPEVLTDC